jgi:hypothetical protein
VETAVGARGDAIEIHPRTVATHLIASKKVTGCGVEERDALLIAGEAFPGGVAPFAGKLP